MINIIHRSSHCKCSVKKVILKKPPTQEFSNIVSCKFWIFKNTLIEDHWVAAFRFKEYLTGPLNISKLVPTKSPMSVFLSGCQFGIFLRNGSLVFSDFLRSSKWLEYLKTDRVLFSRKIHFCPNLGKRGSKWPYFGFFEKFGNSFSWNHLTWKPVLLLIFHHQSLIWQNFGSRVMGENVVGQSYCRIL